jgi:hypothetical protein
MPRTSQRVLTQRHLNRALLARQLLLERVAMPLDDVVEQVGGLQAQYAPSAYVGLWTRVAGFQREALTEALEDRTLIQASLLRTTIHVVSRREFWRYAMAVRDARRAWSLRVQRTQADEGSLTAAAERLREALANGPRDVKDLGGLASGFVGNAGLWVDLVRVPPSGTWARRRADRLALAQDWVGPPDATMEGGLVHVVRAYLRAFGPAPWRDVASWSGIPVSDIARVGERLDLVRHRDEAGRELFDLPDAPLPDPDTPAPVRFLPHWDANLLVHVRRTGLLPEAHRSRVFSTRNPFSVGTYLVDGRVVGGWSVRDGRVVLDPYEDLREPDRAAVEEERAAVEAFHR